jgi:uncharacterized protein YjbI with pentapeptide repeats
MSQQFRLEPKQDGAMRWFVATGELRDARFVCPDEKPVVSFERARLVQVDISDWTFESFRSFNSVFERCDFSRVTFESVALGSTGPAGTQWNHVAWPQSVYRDCVFERTRFGSDNTFFGNARFERCLFDRAKLRKMVFTQEVEFVDCEFRGKVQEVNFWGRPKDRDMVLGRDRNEFRGNDFTQAELVWVAFNDIDLRAQTFPGLPNYALLDRFDERAAAALAIIETWPDEGVKEKLRFNLEFLAEGAGRNDRRDRLISRTGPELGKVPPDVRSRVFDLLVDQGHIQQ